MNSDILESFVEINKIQNDINNKILKFITESNELVELSNDDFQIEKTLKLNKISLKAFILDSSCCETLSDKNITNYKLEDLKQYFKDYEQKTNEDYSKYYLAISIYESIENIENLVDKKIDLEINLLSQIVLNINDIKNTEKDKYEELYFNIKNKLDEEFKNNKLDIKSYNVCIQVFNDVFNFYISGYPTIPDEYLYKDEK